MAAGDAYQVGPTSVAAGAFLALQPVSGSEVVVHNIYYSGAVELYYYNGTNSILLDSDSTAGARLNLTHHCTNGTYVRVKNVSAVSLMIAADGMNTK